MKICFIHDRFKELGGVERHLTNLANELIARNHEVEIVCLDKFYDNFLVNSLDKKIKKTEFRVPRVLGFIPLFFYFLKNRKSYDIVLSIKTYVDMMTIICHKLSFSNSKLYCAIVTLLGLQKKNESQPIHKLALKFIYFACKHLYPYTDGLIVLSQAGIRDIKEFLSKKTSPPLRIIYLTMIDDNYLLKNHTTPDHPWYKSKQNSQTPILIACGRLCVAKNFALLIDSFKLVKEKHPVKLVILGDGALREELEEQVKNYHLEQDIYFAGSVNNPEDYFAHSDLYILTSSYEGFGIVLAESIAAGTPIVTSDRTPICEEMQDFNKFHVCVTDYTPQGFADAIVKQLKALPNYDKSEIKLQARQFTIKNSVDQYEMLFGAAKL